MLEPSPVQLLMVVFDAPLSAQKCEQALQKPRKENNGKYSSRRSKTWTLSQNETSLKVDLWHGVPRMRYYLFLTDWPSLSSLKKKPVELRWQEMSDATRSVRPADTVTCCAPLE